MTEEQRQDVTRLLQLLTMVGLRGHDLTDMAKEGVLAYQAEFERMRAFIRALGEQAQTFFEQ